MKPHLIMPMGGEGSRFYKNGYMQPKPLIDINGKPFFYWATMSIKKFIDIEDLTFVVLQRHIDEFGIDKEIKSFFPKANIVVLPKVLPGPVYTVLEGIKNINDNEPIIINDCDHMFKCNELNERFNLNNFCEDGALLTFESNEPQYSYIKYDENDNIIGTIEKQVVSSHAICGAYIISSADLFRKMAEIYFEECPYNECFISGIYNVMCKNNMSINRYLLDFHVEFGTPKEYEEAKKSPFFEDIL